MEVVHLIREKTGSNPRYVKKDLTTNTFYAKCGYSHRVPDDRKPPEFTVWASQVTCQECRV